MFILVGDVVELYGICDVFGVKMLLMSFMKFMIGYS